MAEKFSSLEVNDWMDSILSDEPIENDLIFSNGKDPVGAVNDLVSNTIEHNKGISKKRINREKEEQARTDKMSKEMKEDLKRERKHRVWRVMGSLFLPTTWIKWIQYWEDLLYVAFVDTTLLLTLFSLLLITYIIVTFEANDNWVVFVCKITGTIALCVLSMIVQMNANPQNKGK